MAIFLACSSWMISLSVRQLEDGHVMSMRSTGGHVISLLIRDRQAVLTLYRENSSEEAIGSVLDEGVFTAVV